jgi:hypothetical protein
VLRNPDPETWIKWVREFEDICASIPIKDPRQKANSTSQFLAGNAKEVWQKHHAEAVAFYAHYLNTENAQGPTLIAAYKKVFERTVNNCTKEFLGSEHPSRKQVQYMRYHLSTEGYTIREFANRLKVLNSYLPYFPPKHPSGPKMESLEEDEMVDILVRAVPVDMHIASMKANINPHNMSWEEILNYLERLELSLALEKQNKSNNTPAKAKSDDGDSPKKETGKRKREGNDNKSSISDKEKPKRWCTHCENGTHNTEQCWFKDKNRSKKPNGKKKENTFTVEQVHALLQNLPSHNSRSGKNKRKIRYDSDESSSTQEENAYTPERGSNRG